MDALFDDLLNAVAAEVGSSFWAFTCIAAAKLEVESLRGRVVIFISSMCFFLCSAACCSFLKPFLAELRLPALKGVVSGSLSTVEIFSALVNEDLSLAGVDDIEVTAFPAFLTPGSSC